MDKSQIKKKLKVGLLLVNYLKIFSVKIKKITLL